MQSMNVRKTGGLFVITYEMLSETGERDKNEDSIRVLQTQEGICAALGDGLGGHGYGEEASRLVTECVTEIFKKNAQVSEEVIRQCFEESQKRLVEKQKKAGKEYGMKTTLCVFLSDERRFLWGHIGDSRIYHFAGKKLAECTFDHSVPQMLVAAGEITSKQIRRHPDRSRLLRVMGMEWRRTPYVISDFHDYEPGHAILMCSDGFWEWIEEDEMESCLEKAETAADWLNSMKEIVRKNGEGQGMDNYSAICIWT